MCLCLYNSTLINCYTNSPKTAGRGIFQAQTHNYSSKQTLQTPVNTLLDTDRLYYKLTRLRNLGVDLVVQSPSVSHRPLLQRYGPYGRVRSP